MGNEKVVMKKIAILVFAFALLQAAQIASAVPDANTTPHSSLPGVTFTMDGGSAQVDCVVSKIIDGTYADNYLYTYRITNNSSVGLSFFSIAVTNGAAINDWGRDTGVDTVNPLQWTPVIDGDTSLVQSVDALFNLPIKNTQTSALLWFVSDNASASGQGALFGTSAGAPCYATAELFAPVPEPATISLLAFGGILAARARRKNNF
jgi:hypothetical protein